MYGWRARLGVLVPSGNIVTEPEFNRVVPEGVTCHYHRFAFTGDGRNQDVMGGVRAAAENIAGAAAMVGAARPSVIAMTGTAVTFIGGGGYDLKLIEEMRRRTGDIPVTTTSTSVIDAFHRLGAARVSVAMPYIEEVARALIRFIEDNGIPVLKYQWLDKRGFEISEVSGETLRRLAAEVDTPESEAVLISCTSLHTFEVIEDIERELKKPVVTSNQATLWNMLRLAGIEDKIEGYGRLFSRY